MHAVAEKERGNLKARVLSFEIEGVAWREKREDGSDRYFVRAGSRREEYRFGVCVRLRWAAEAIRSRIRAFSFCHERNLFVSIRPGPPSSRQKRSRPVQLPSSRRYPRPPLLASRSADDLKFRMRITHPAPDFSMSRVTNASVRAK